MIKIYKYPFPPAEKWPALIENDYVRLGARAPVVQLLDLQVQNGIVTLWAIVNTDEEDLPWEFFGFPTGYEMKDDGIRLEYFKTLQLDNGLVFHFFYIPQYVHPAIPKEKKFLGTDR